MNSFGASYEACGGNAIGGRQLDREYGAMS